LLTKIKSPVKSVGIIEFEGTLKGSKIKPLNTKTSNNTGNNSIDHCTAFGRCECDSDLENFKKIKKLKNLDMPDLFSKDSSDVVCVVDLPEKKNRSIKTIAIANAIATNNQVKTSQAKNASAFSIVIFFSLEQNGYIISIKSKPIKWFT
jgi:hypothetical protein